MSLPLVLLVEDDESLQRFVKLALEMLDIELLCCASVDAAQQILQTRHVDLLLTDLMLPDRSGFELIEALRDAPLKPRRLVVYTAGISEQVRQRLATANVWRFLSKPCSVKALEACVSEALIDVKSQANPGLALPGSSEEADPVMSAFGGNRLLYEAFRESCRQQFPIDVEQGARFSREGDLAGLQRLAHNLKSVLQTLGFREAAALARELELCAEVRDGAPALALWDRLSAALRESGSG